MQQLLLFFWQICLMREGPHRAPSATAFLALVACVYCLLSTLFVLITRSAVSLLPAVVIVLIGLAVQFACVWLLLLFKRYTGRFRKTIVTLLGTGSILTVLMLPFNVALLLSDSETVRLFSETSYWIFFGWWLAVAGYIYHRSLNVSILQGSAIAFLIEVLSVIAAAPMQPVS